MATAAAEALSGALTARVEEALRRAAAGRRPVLASATLELGAGVDPAATVFASRRADERWFAWEQPDRDGFALGALGTAHAVDSAPAGDRFGAAAHECSELMRDAVIGEPPDRLAAGPVWVGGFAFFPDGGRDPQWASLPATLLVLPEVSLARSGDETAVTANLICRAGDEPGALVDRVLGRVAALRRRRAAACRPRPGGRVRDRERPAAPAVRAVRCRGCAPGART